MLYHLINFGLQLGKAKKKINKLIKIEILFNFN